MNFAHLHLIINHIPLLTMPIALVFLLASLYWRDERLKRFSLIILVVTAATVLPVYFTGEPAEKTVESLPGVTEQVIEPHEEAAEFALIATLICGALAIGNLVFANHQKSKKILTSFVVGSCVVAVLALGYTSNLGGKIRHIETTDAFQFQESTAEK